MPGSGRLFAGPGRAMRAADAGAGHLGGRTSLCGACAAPLGDSGRICAVCFPCRDVPAQKERTPAVGLAADRDCGFGRRHLAVQSGRGPGSAGGADEQSLCGCYGERNVAGAVPGRKQHDCP